jgi:hypothetical protein
VQQGGTISPLLYNILIDELAGRLATAGLGVQIEGLHVPGALYADDVALVASSPEALQSALRMCEEHSQEALYRWKPSKCCWIGPATPAITSPVFRLYGRPLAKVPVFKYLGIPFNGDGVDAAGLVAQNSERFLGSVQTLLGLGLNAYGHQAHRSVHGLRTFAQPRLEYGLAIAPLTDEQKDALRKTQLQRVMRMLGAHGTCSHEALMRLAGVTSMDVRVEGLQCAWVWRLLTAPVNT